MLTMQEREYVENSSTLTRQEKEWLKNRPRYYTSDKAISGYDWARYKKWEWSRLIYFVDEYEAEDAIKMMEEAGEFESKVVKWMINHPMKPITSTEYLSFISTPTKFTIIPPKDVYLQQARLAVEAEMDTYKEN